MNSAFNAVPAPAGSPFRHNIYLIGFMGTGKSTVADFLGRLHHLDVIEMDQLIAQREGMSIPEIFQNRGEEYFRNAETRLLIELQGCSHTVISCGGGVPLREANVLALKKRGLAVLLTAEPETVLERLRDFHDRPLIENNKNAAFIGSLMEQRRAKYEAAADITVRTDEKTVPEVCAEITQKILEAEKAAQTVPSQSS